jgi:hypothetical protein
MTEREWLEFTVIKLIEDAIKRSYYDEKFEKEFGFVPPMGNFEDENEE